MPRRCHGRKVVSEDLSVYVRNAVTLDPSCAPEGHSALYILAPAPNNTSGIDWEAHREAYSERILDIIAQRTGYSDLRAHIQTADGDHTRRLGRQDVGLPGSYVQYGPWMEADVVLPSA